MFKYLTNVRLSFNLLYQLFTSGKICSVCFQPQYNLAQKSSLPAFHLLLLNCQNLMWFRFGCQASILCLGIIFPTLTEWHFSPTALLLKRSFPVRSVTFNSSCVNPNCVLNFELEIVIKAKET